MKISIALCTYNGENFLLEQLESFVNQTHLPDELIVCDDCSADKTVEILTDFKKDSPFPIQIHINKEILGSAKNFEKAISFCTGDIIFLSDQDDVWMSEKIQTIKTEFDKNGDLGLVFTDADVVDENLRPFGFKLTDVTLNKRIVEKLIEGKTFDCFLGCNIVTGATIAFRSIFRNKITPFPTHIPEMIHDAWIALAIVLMSEYKFINKPLIKYRQHDLQQIGLRNFLSRRKPGVNVNFLKNQLAMRELLIIRNRKILKWMKEYTDDLLPFVYKIKSLSRLITNNEKDEILHCQLRANLSSSIPKRVIPILKELISGRYHRFSNGFLSMVRDVLKGKFVRD